MSTMGRKKKPPNEPIGRWLLSVVSLTLNNDIA